MDTISLKPYSRPDDLPQRREFLEFFINDKPLSELLNKFYGSKKSILENWIGVLGSFANLQAEVIKLKQLLGRHVTDKDIAAAFLQHGAPATWNDVSKYRDELEDPEVLIYCCAACGDYDCGGIAVRINREEDMTTWTVLEGNGSLVLTFNKYHYFDVFGSRLQYVQKKLRGDTFRYTEENN
jgi:hypothetical protein